MADLLLRNARIWTAASDQPWADAALIRDGRFSFVGREAGLPSSGTEVLDAGGQLVLPGLIDGHAHLMQTGMARRAVDLKEVPSVSKAVRLVAERAARTPEGGWIQGAGWDQNLWPGAAFPSKRELDTSTPGQPVVLVHTSGHCIWVNSAALMAAGVTSETEPPVGGRIDFDADGQPTGILRDTAAELVHRAIPTPSEEERIAAIADATAHAHSLGLTGVHAMDARRGEFIAMRALRERAGLQLRVRAYLSDAQLEGWIEDGLRTGDGDDMLRVGGVKFFADGALGSLTAWMLEPYEGSSDCGLSLHAPGDLERRVRLCLASGLAPAIHAIGDRANQEVLDTLDRAQSLHPELPRRIEHAQVLAADDVARFARLGLTASVQPIHATQDYTKVDREWGERGRHAYAFASLLASGTNLAFGSDSPVETMNPIAGIHAAVTRETADGEPPGGWYPAERISLDAAIAAYTTGCAAAVHESDSAGKIAPGYFGDFVILSDDLFAMEDPARFIEAKPEVTVVGGEIVFRKA